MNNQPCGPKKNLAEVLLIMICQDPTFDMNYITSTYTR
ncbi:MAG: hypothetical protein AB8V23_00055 [Candidatus Midichloria sp.]